MFVITVYKQHVNRALAIKINNAIQAVDPKALFVRLEQPGNDIHGWIERPNDGNNSANFMRDRNAQVKAIADKMLGF